MKEFRKGGMFAVALIQNKPQWESCEVKADKKLTWY